MHIGIEGSADDFNDLRANLHIRVLQDRANGTEPGQIRDQLPLRKDAGDIDGLDIELRPATFIEDLLNAACIRECELAGRARATGWKVWQQRRGGALGGCHEWILRRATPYDAAQLGVGARGLPQVRECSDGILEEHYAEA